MKKHVIKAIVPAIVIAAFAVGAHSTIGQKSGLEVKEIDRLPFAADKHPYDFSDKFYEDNGIVPFLMAERRSGEDGMSVFGHTSDPNRRGVRITATMTAYGTNGEMLFFNLYGELQKGAFLQDPSGDEALKLAERYPVYMFPSATVKNSDRQAAMIEIDDSYAQKNPLGIGLAINVEYTAAIYTEKGSLLMRQFADKNGISLDGTPIIRTLKQLNELTRHGMVKLTVRGAGEPKISPFVAARVLTDPTDGAVADDAFLVFVEKPDGKPLDSEKIFLDNFECLKSAGKYCKN